ncbi:MAG TPA: hypothetical protein VF209_00605 [Patescibacteria group bacterium]
MRVLAFLLVAVTIITAVTAPAVAQEEGWTISGPVPIQVVPLKFQLNEANATTCTVPGACWMFAESGVLSAARYEDAEANESAVWSGAGDVQELFEGETTDLILPESGYLMIWWSGGDVSCGDFTITQEPSEDHVWALVLRGRHEGPGDRNTICNFSNYTAGAALATIYAVPVQASAFFAQGYFAENARNSMTRKNCGATGCDSGSFIALDVNDGAYTVGDFDLVNDQVQFVLVETNTD